VPAPPSLPFFFELPREDERNGYVTGECLVPFSFFLHSPSPVFEAADRKIKQKKERLCLNSFFIFLPQRAEGERGGLSPLLPFPFFFFHRPPLSGGNMLPNAKAQHREWLQFLLFPSNAFFSLFCAWGDKQAVIRFSSAIFSIPFFPPSLVPFRVIGRVRDARSTTIYLGSPFPLFPDQVKGLGSKRG